VEDDADRTAWSQGSRRRCFAHDSGCGALRGQQRARTARCAHYRGTHDSSESVESAARGEEWSSRLGEDHYEIIHELTLADRKKMERLHPHPSLSRKTREGNKH